MLIGVALGVAVGALLGLNTWSWWFLGVSGCVLSLPALADVVAQMISAYSSTVLRRSTTGLLLGLGVVCTGTMVRIVALGSPGGHSIPDLFSSTATARLEAKR